MKRFFKGLKGSYLALILLFLYSPIAIMIAFSFNAGKSRAKWEGFSFKWYGELFNNAAIMDALRITLTVAVIATVVSVILGTLGAIGIHACKKGWATALINLSYLPMTMPDIVTGLGFDRWNMIGTEGAVLYGMVYNYLPFMVLPIYTVLKKMDYSVIEAAEDLGCNPLRVMTRVVIPMSVPGIVSGVTMVFMPAVTSFAISTLLSNGKLRLAGDLIDYIFNQSSNPNRWNIGSSFSLMMLVLILISIGFLRKVDPDSEGGGMW